MNNNERFLKIYKELETIVYEKYELSIDEFLDKTNDKFILSNSYYLDTLRKLRNVLSHYQDNIDLIMINELTINKLEYIKEYIKNPPIVKNIYIPLNKIIYAKDIDLILPLYKIMQEKGFSHIPILDNKSRVIGVFDGNVMTSSLLLNKNFCIKDDLKFNDPYIKPFTLLDNQYFNTYLFIKESSSINDILNLFNNHKKDLKKISMLFVTRNGSAKEELLGLITPNDILTKKM